nr:SDR family NAD(P)-dependent oxidoreductase [uncultured Pseudomonas sp.]
MDDSQSFWVTASTNGLGAALIEQLVEQHARVAASGRNNLQFHAMARRHGNHLLALYGDTQHQADRLKLEWGALDTLIVNAGTCDYLPADLTENQLLQALIKTNAEAVERYLDAALPLLVEARRPHVVVILNLYTAAKLSDPSFPASVATSLPERLREKRAKFRQLGIDLTVVTPYAAPSQHPVPRIPEQWTAQSAAIEILSRLPDREEEIVLEALGLRTLWPLKSF